MATQRKQNAPMKEKRGTSPSPLKLQPQSTPIPTKPKKVPLSSSLDHHQKLIPNYLKPTISSGHVDDQNPPPKRQGGISTTAKPTNTFNRRRSFDKPPSPTPSTLHNKWTHNKPVLSKTTSMPKPMRRAQRPSVKTSTSVKKINSNLTSMSTNEKIENNGKGNEISVDTTPVVEAHNKQGDHEELLANDGDEVVKVEIKNGEMVSEMEDKKHVLEEGHDMEENKSGEDVKACLDDKNECVDVEMEGGVVHEENVLVDQEIVIDNLEHGEQNEKENEVVLEGGDEEGKENEEGEMENARDEEELKGRNNDEVENGDESQAVSKVLGETKQEEGKGTENENEENYVGKKVKNDEVAIASGHEKREKDPQQQVYNDVIEETASKLLEKKKNKVKALVGAFETVISLQEPDS